jgi:hypothetical protein
MNRPPASYCSPETTVAESRVGGAGPPAWALSPGAASNKTKTTGGQKRIHFSIATENESGFGESAPSAGGDSSKTGSLKSAEVFFLTVDIRIMVNVRVRGKPRKKS